MAEGIIFVKPSSLAIMNEIFIHKDYFVNNTICSATNHNVQLDGLVQIVLYFSETGMNERGGGYLLGRRYCKLSKWRILVE